MKFSNQLKKKEIFNSICRKTYKLSCKVRRKR